MRAKQFLKRIKEIDTAIKIKNEELERLAEKAISICSFSDGEKVQSSKLTADRMANDVAKYIDLRTEIAFDTISLAKERQAILETVSRLPSSEHEVLYMRYARYINFDEIAEELERSRRWVIDKHSKGLKDLQKILDEVE